MIEERIDEEAMERLCAQATPGPWWLGRTAQGDESGVMENLLEAYRKGEEGSLWLTCVPAPGVEDAENVVGWSAEDALYTAITGNGPNSEVNALFIAAAREFVPAAIQRLRGLRAQLGSLNAELGLLKKEEDAYRCSDWAKRIAEQAAALQEARARVEWLESEVRDKGTQAATAREREKEWRRQAELAGAQILAAALDERAAVVDYLSEREEHVKTDDWPDGLVIVQDMIRFIKAGQHRR